MLYNPAMSVNLSPGGGCRNGHPKQVHRQNEAGQLAKIGDHHDIEEGNPHATAQKATRGLTDLCATIARQQSSN
jgi:hypothetical protein